MYKLIKINELEKGKYKTEMYKTKYFVIAFFYSWLFSCIIEKKDLHLRLSNFSYFLCCVCFSYFKRSFKKMLH